MTDGSVVVALLRLVVSLAVVLTLLVVLARYAARRGVGGGRIGGPSVSVDVLARRPLGRTASVQVVRVGEQVMLLGVTEGSVSVLGELEAAALAVPAPVAGPAGLSAAAQAEPGTAAAHAPASRSARRAAVTPTGWPWSAAALLLGRGAVRG